MLWVRVAGGSGTATRIATASVDSPFNVASLVQLKDSFGTPIIVAPGYEAFNLIQMFGGQYGTDMNANPLAIGGTYIRCRTCSASTGRSFQFSTYSLEFAKAYGVIAGANAREPPATLQFNLNTAANFFGATQPYDRGHHQPDG